MIRAILLLSLLSIAACGVQGDLYLPGQEPPKRDRSTTPTPFPQQSPEEQNILPDPI